MVKKTIENLRIVLEHTTSDKEAIESEIQLLDAFVLKQLTEERIRAIKKEIVARDAKTLMQFLNTNYKGRFDGKLAMQIVMKKKSFKLFFYYSSSVLSLFNSYSLIRKAEHNLDYTELKTIVTRAGVGSRVVLTGDVAQDDLARKKKVSGMGAFMRVVENMDHSFFKTVEFLLEDVVRSGLCSAFLISEYELNKDNTEEE